MTIFRPLVVAFAAVSLLMFGGVSRAADLPGAGPAHMGQLGQLGAGDSVSIQVFGQTDTTNVYVGDDGMISVPLAGNIQVAGMSPVDAAARVAKALKDGGYFVDPHVTLIVTQQHSQLVSVVGEVAAVGRYPINPHTTIMDLLAQAGGLKLTAADVGYVLRTDDNGQVTRHPVKLPGLGDSSDIDTQPNFKLLGGDSLLVPRAEHVFVQGEVATPGTYPIESGMTVIQAIARAGGVNERGSERRIELKRRGKDGQYQVLRVKPGDLIQANDMIRVKESIF